MVVNPMPRSSLGAEPNNATTVGGPACVGGGCLWFAVGTFIGCDAPSFDYVGDVQRPGNIRTDALNIYDLPTQYPDFCPIENFPDGKEWQDTLPDYARTWNVQSNSNPRGDWTKWNPWRKPGASPVGDACGNAGGYYTTGKAYQGTQIAVPDLDVYPNLSPGTAILEPLMDVDGKMIITPWEAGSVVEIEWAIMANHGGGYQFRLCKQDEDQTEECFQKTVLEFANSNHTIKYFDGSNQIFDIPAVEVSVGTVPEHSTWRRNPIPACACDFGVLCGEIMANTVFASEKPDDKATPYPASGPYNEKTPRCPNGTQFPPAWEDGYGYGGAFCEHSHPGVEHWECPDVFKWKIADKVKIPEGIEGKYTLQWRWDCESTAQVWDTCSDIEITKPAARTEVKGARPESLRKKLAERLGRFEHPNM